MSESNYKKIKAYLKNETDTEKKLKIYRDPGFLSFMFEDMMENQKKNNKNNNCLTIISILVSAMAALFSLIALF